MYCRFCGNLVHDKAVICVKCKNKPLLGRAYCQNCGATTTQQQTVCTKCGMKLQAELSGVQKRLNYVTKKIESYELAMKNSKSMMKLCVIGAIISVVLLFLSPIIHNTSFTGGALGILLAAIVVFFPNLIGYIALKHICKKYKQELKRIQGGQRK